MIITNGALQLVTGSPANGGNIIIPEHFKAAAMAAAEKVRRGLCKKLTSLRVVINLSNKTSWSSNDMESSGLPIILSLVTLFKPLSIFFLFSTATGLTNL
jgi:hypothetical protein